MKYVNVRNNYTVIVNKDIATVISENFVVSTYRICLNPLREL